MTLTRILLGVFIGMFAGMFSAAVSVWLTFWTATLIGCYVILRLVIEVRSFRSKL